MNERISVPVPPCRLRVVLQGDRLAVGTMVTELHQTSLLTLLAQAGFDFVILDWEHGAFSLETIAFLCRAARETGMTPIVRPPELTYAWITQPLDAGAQGIMLPRVTRRDQIESALAYMKYPPQGRRGAVLARGHTRFLAGPLEPTLAALNQESFLIVQIETREAVDQVDELLAVPGVDAALVGPTDLSLALGVPGQFDHPTLTGAIERTLAACLRHRVVPAIHTNEVELTAAWARRGMRLVSFSSEIGILFQGARAAVTAIRG